MELLLFIITLFVVGMYVLLGFTYDRLVDILKELKKLNSTKRKVPK